MAATVDFSDFHQEPDLAAQMRVPETIRVESNSDSFYQTSPSSASSDLSKASNAMSVPERIFVNGDMGGFSTPRSDLSRELKDDFIPTGTGNAYMGGMATPPRTLTVDDTTSAHYPQAKPANAAEQGKGGEKPTAHHHLHGKAKENRERRHIDDECIKTGLEIIDEVHPMDDDSEEGSFATEYEVTDLRKSVVLLHRRVSMLEREVDNNSFGFWSKIFVFTMTIVNPLLLQWLFGGKRR